MSGLTTTTTSSNPAPNDEIDDAFAVHPDRGELLQASAVSTGPPGSEDDEGRTVHHDQRTIAEAQVNPAPKPVMSA